MNNKEILANAPEGATHYDNGEYLKTENLWWFGFTATVGWDESRPENLTRKLSDIHTIAEQAERIAEFEAHNLGLTKSLVELEQEREMRDLEQQERGLMDFLDEVDTWSLMNTYAVTVDDFYERIKNLRKQARQLGGEE